MMKQRKSRGFSFCFGKISPGNEQSFGLLEIAKGYESIVDIVAVHGLNGHREKTWTAGNGVNWLRNFLPFDLPNARIFSYGYEARTHATSPVGEETFHEHGKQLVETLYNIRKKSNTNERPIIFIAHSLGGIVVKAALRHSYMCNPSSHAEHRSITLSTYGIFFMGTPHQGGNGVEIASFILKFAQLVIWTDDTLLKSLARGSEWLKQLNNDYYHVAKQRKFDTKMCYETRATEIIPRVLALLVVPKDSAVVKLPKADPVPMNAGHRDMVRYRSRDDQGYQMVIEHLKEMTEDASAPIALRWKEEHRINQILSKGYSVNFSTRNFPREKAFVGRKEELKQIYQKLQVKDEQSIVVLHGLSGMGKTQLAVAYAWEHKGDYDAVFWLNSNDADTLRRSFVDVAHRISKEHPAYFPGFLYLVREYERGSALAQDIEEESGRVVEIRDKAVEEVSSFLSEKGNTKWLLIFDNYNTPNIGANSNDPAAFSLKSFLPDACHGNIIVTSTSSEHMIGELIPIKKVQEIKDCLLILSHNSGRPNLEQDSGALELAKKLDGLPLALAIAGAYLRQTAMSFSIYLEQYNERWTKVQEKSPTLKHYDKTLLTTWDLSLDQVREINRNSEKLLLLWAYFDSQDIWLEMLQAGRDDTQEEWFREITEDVLEFEDAMQPLCQYSLAEPNPAPPPEGGESHGYSMHACVHEWTKNVLNKEKCIEMAKLAFSCITKQVPYLRTRNYLVLKQRLTEHVHQCLKPIQAEPEQHDDLSILFGLNALGNWYKNEGKLDEAEGLYQRALRGRRRLLGEDDQKTLHTINNLGLLYLRRGNFGKAREMLETALQGSEKRLGPDHNSTLSIITNLGVVFRQLEVFDQAEVMYQRALEGSRKERGEDDPATLSVTGDLGYLYYVQAIQSGLKDESYVQKLLGKAAHFTQLAWKGNEKVLGTKHPSTLSKIDTLALIYDKQQRPAAETEEMYRLALQMSEKIYGVNDPQTLTVVCNMGSFYQRHQRLAEAEKMYLRRFQGHEIARGADHISTLNAAYDLGHVYRQQGSQADAEKEYQQEKLAKAVVLHQKALKGYKRICGADNLRTLDTQASLGSSYALQGQLSDARRLLDETWKRCKEVLGPVHPSSRWAENALIDVYRRQGYSRQAEEMEQLLFRRTVSSHWGKYPPTPQGQLLIEWKEDAV